MSAGTPTPHTFRVLGPLEVTVDGRSVAITAPIQRIILATLLLRANEWVRADQLISAIWDDRSPDNPRASLYIHMARLRAWFTRTGSLPADRQPIATRTGAYRLTVEPDALDLHRFARLTRQSREARRGGDRETELALVKRALAEWRGEPLALVPSARLQAEAVTRLRDDHLRWLERRFQLELELGRHAEVLDEIRGAAHAYPQCERLWEHLMLALERCEDRAGALEAYQRLSRRLRDEFDAQPGAGLRQLHRQLVTTARPASPTAPAIGHRQELSDPPWQPQCQLPADIADFTGRAQALAEIQEILRPQPAGSATAVVCLTGAPGVGKTALALHVAHQLRDRFPDGQWHLRINEADGTRREWRDALVELLGTVGIDPALGDAPAAIGALRARLAHRRVLLIIDDVDDSRWLCDLLPLGSNCAVLITHRGDPTELVVRAGARIVRLDALTVPEATSLLTQVLGDHRVTAEPAALTGLIDICDRLPLALRIAGAYLATHPDQGIAAFTERLRGDDPLTELALGDDARAAVRTTFRLSYRALPASTRRYFRLLAAVPGMVHTAHTVAALAGEPGARADRALEQLVTAHLVERDLEGRYRFHNLLARFATECLRQEEDPAELRAAARRLGRRYLGLTGAAVRLCYSDGVRLPPTITPPDGPTPFDSRRVGRSWLRVERQNLVAYIVFAAGLGLSSEALHLTDLLRDYFALDRCYADWLVVARAAGHAVQSAERPAPAAVAVARLNLGLALQGTNDLPAAEPHLRFALAEFRRLELPAFEVIAINALAMHQLQHPVKRFDESICLLERALRLGRQLGLRDAQARTLLYLGMARQGRGDPRIARRHLIAALGLLNGGAACSVRPEVHARLGFVCAELGEYGEASHHLRAALRLGLRAHSPYPIALASVGLARVHQHANRLGHAHRNLSRALSIIERNGYRALHVHARNQLAALYRAEGRPRLARREHQLALDEAERIGHPQGRCEALLGLSVLAREGGGRDAAREFAERARTAATQSGSHRLAARVTALLAELTGGEHRRSPVTGRRPGPGRLYPMSSAV